MQAFIGAFCSATLEHSCIATQKKMLPSSPFVSEIIAPSYIKICDAFLLACDRNCYLQSVVASDSFYGSSEDRFDSVMVTNEEGRKESDSNFKKRCWFAKVLRFVNVDVNPEGGRL